MRIPARYLVLILCALVSTLTANAELSENTKASVKKLWQQVEEKIPVEQAKRHKVVDPPSHVDIGADPTRKSEWRTSALKEARLEGLKFPKNFIYGVASAAAQVEGAVKADNRGPSIWDSYCHLVPAQVKEQSCQSMDVATNFRNLYPLDLARVSAMDVKAYSFSISWSRIMPMGESRSKRER